MRRVWPGLPGRTRLLPASLATCAILLSGTAQAGSTEWSSLPPLPNSIGVAGPFAGVSHGALLVAGGANFPDRPPWEGGQKVWQDAVYVLPAVDGAWQTAGNLPRSLAYGVSVTTEGGVICIGGSDATKHHAEVFRLRWGEGRLTTEDLPPLPHPLANACGAQVGSVVYVTGGIERPDATQALSNFWSFDLATPDAGWRELEPWPGPGRMLATAAVQDGAFFLVGGVALSAGADGRPVREYLQDAYCHREGKGWKRVTDLPRPVAAAPSPAPPAGQSAFWVLGGDDGSKVGFEPLAEHPGFSKTILAYHLITDTWSEVGTMPAGPVTTTVVGWDGWFVVPSGETRPGVRTPECRQLRPGTGRTAFGMVNHTVVILYLLGMVGIGVACSRRTRGTNDFFRGGQRIPWWAAGLSIFATMLSSITFMAIPAVAYAGGWNLFLANSYILITPLVVLVFLPFYRRLNVTTAYEYLELRFNQATRMLGSLLFMLFQCGRIAIVLYLPALALATVSDFNIHTAILILGGLCLIYTVLGGIEAVIWTDVAQTFILLGGALFSLVYILMHVDGGLAGAWQTASEHGKFFAGVNWTWDLTVASGWVIVLGSLFHNLFPYTASQDVVQRYLTTRDQRTAARGIWLNALLSVPAQAVFFALGTALFVFYRQHAARLDTGLQNDAIFPFFIVSELPVGLAGLVVAGLFAASQSTLSSSLNSIATAWVTDFHRHLRPNLDDQACLRVARWVTVIVGLAGTGIALAIALLDLRSMYSAFLALIGLMGGTLSGLFVLGIFSRSANGRGALAGALLSVVVVFSVRFLHPLNVFAYAPIGLITAVATGWLSSLALPAGNRDLDGLTLRSTLYPEQNR